MYVSDTNIVSVNAPGQAQRHPLIAAWLDHNSADIFLSVVTLAEIEAGIAKSVRQGATAKAERLAVWFERVLRLYSGRILNLDAPSARLAGRLTDVALRNGYRPEFADSAIAATAKVHGYTVLTRNLRHFHPLGVPAIDPFAGLPPT